MWLRLGGRQAVALSAVVRIGIGGTGPYRPQFHLTTGEVVEPAQTWATRDEAYAAGEAAVLPTQIKDI